MGLGLLTGCPKGGQEQAAPAPAQPQQEEAAATTDEPEPQGEPVTITITGNDMMRFDTTAFSVKPRQPVTIVFKNVGTMPKESMGHNVVVLKQGVDVMGFANAATAHARNDYINPERKDEVIAFTPILGPGEEAEVSFTAPAETGDYDYICSFPGHAASGMVGVMTVEE